MRRFVHLLMFSLVASTSFVGRADARISNKNAALLSLVLPGLGQYKLGDTRMAGIFAGVEGLSLGSYITFRREESLRRESQALFAEIHARVHIQGQPDGFDRDVGSYISSDEFNRNIVLFNAENIYAGAPDSSRVALVKKFLDQYSYTGSQAWGWDTNDNRIQYLVILKSGLSANQNGHYALGILVANHLLSAVDALRPRRENDEKLGLWQAVPSLQLRPDNSPTLTWSASF